MLVLIVGEPFTGKTTSACTFPKPLTLLDFDGGFESVKHAKDSAGNLIVPDWNEIQIVTLYHREYFNLDFNTAEKSDFAAGKYPIHTVHSSETISKYNDAIKKAYDNPPKTLVIDSLTTMFRVWKDAILYTNKIPALRIADYGTLEGLLFRQFIPTLKSIRDKIEWVILIDHETVDKDEITGAITEFPIGPSNSMGRALPKEFDEVWRQKVEGNRYIWRTKKHGMFIGAGSRLHLPDGIEANYKTLKGILDKRR